MVYSSLQALIYECRNNLGIRLLTNNRLFISSPRRIPVSPFRDNILTKVNIMELGRGGRSMKSAVALHGRTNVSRLVSLQANLRHPLIQTVCRTINATTHHYLTMVLVVDERKSSVDRGVIHFPVLVSLSPSIMLTSPSYISPASSPPATLRSDPATAPVFSRLHLAVHRQPDLHSGTQAAERQPFLVVGN